MERSSSRVPRMWTVAPALLFVAAAAVAQSTGTLPPSLQPSQIMPRVTEPPAAVQTAMAKTPRAKRPIEPSAER